MRSPTLSSHLCLLLSFISILSASVIALPTTHQARSPTTLITSAPSDVHGKTFSYIVVGGGTAGLVVAARLAEDPTKTVVVLEAGNSHIEDPLIQVPVNVGAVYGNPEYDWTYKTVPQKKADNAVLAFTRGKILGGCSAINAMIWDRSSKPEYDNIQLLGNKGWDWNSLFPYMKKPENFIEPDPVFAAKWNQTFDLEARGKGGPIDTIFPNYLPDAEFPQESAATELGIPIVREPMGGVITGAWKGETSIDYNTRTRVYSAHYVTAAEAAGRTNLLVLTGAQVTKINWARDHFPLANGTSSSNTTAQTETDTSSFGTVTASGVSFIVNGTTYSVGATREVVLSASTIGSPYLLELSGVGDKKRLSKVGVKSVVDLPGVGENMQEHIFVTQSFVVNKGVETLDALLHNQSFFDEQALLFQQRPAQGALGYGATGISMVGLPTFIPSWRKLLASARSQLSKKSRTIGQEKQQDLQLALLASRGSSVVEVLSEGVHGTVDEADPTKSYVSFLTLLQQPFSRGSTHINSADPTTYPTIDPNYFDIDFDLKVLTSIAQWVRSTWTKTKAFGSIIASESFPGPEVQTQAQWESWVKATFQSQGHTTGTCSMLPRSEGGVVDPTLKVYGTSNVRVADLSVMPQQFSGHPQALAYTIGEKAADLIKFANL
ncbi:unnamed protein product [Somion occarium]|uniref:Glucose-methanol-choline oxidoreductase N-terminal domain-containing protein n=1 Tax=Somion occarium TaxID=3059160 RepID=A0ABP1DS15_9APHY